MPRIKKTCQKQYIPKSLKQAVWLRHAGCVYESKCTVTWCPTVITPFTFEAGHDVPESKGGATTIDNLYPICTQCNKSMGNHFTIAEFSKAFAPKVDNETNTTQKVKVKGCLQLFSKRFRKNKVQSVMD